MPSSLTAVKEDPVNILVVDDHPVFQEGLRLTLSNAMPEAKLSSATTLADARETLGSESAIDLILLDLSLPDGKGFALLRHIKKTKLFIPCIVLSASEESFDIKTALQAGASGFICKSSGCQNISKQINEVLAGQVSVPDFYCIPDEDLLAIDSGTLTPRQKEVLQLLAEGLPNKVICQRLNLTEHTVKTHIKALFQHFQVHTRTECVRVAALLEEL